MSWNWDTKEEVKKDYTPAGTVTISCEEYRDLIHRIYELREAGNKEHEDWYKEYNKRQEAEKQLSDSTQTINKLQKYKIFVEHFEDVNSKFKMWRLEQEEEETSEDE